MHKKILIICLVLVSQMAFGQKPEKFQINGAARAYFFANEMDLDESLDSITTRKANYGHTLLDLGFNINPNENTEIIGMFRIRNELGGFWGGGVSFDVRQLSLKGVAGNVVRYELGDIDLKMTPYTLYNFREEGIVNEADVFSLRRDIVHYDMFYTKNNTWRMQGAMAGFGLQFSKVIEEMQFKGFITRQRATDGISNPERLYGGGSLKIIQSKNMSIGFNNVNIFDLTKTTSDSLQYKNNVYTTDFKYTRSLKENTSMGIKGEAGISSARYINYQDERAPAELNEWFYDVALVSEMEDKGISISLGYKDIGADFLSPGAQTKRINFGKFPGLYQQFTNDAIGRPISYSDVISGNTENAFQISEQLMPYYAAYNNTNPYGLATPNRKGMYLEATRTDSTKFRKSFVNVAALTESRGTGTTEKKNFLLIEAGTDLYINDFIGSDKQIKLDLGLRLESTNRGGEVYESIDLNSTMIDLGLSVEFIPNLDLLLGAKLWNVAGNAYIDERNAFNTIENFDIVSYDFSENTYAGGLRYRFNENNTLSAQYQLFNIEHKDEALVDYGISQFTFLYSLSF